MRAHFPRNETLDSLRSLSSSVLNLLSRVKSRTADRGQWGMDSTNRQQFNEKIKFPGWSAGPNKLLYK